MSRDDDVLGAARDLVEAFGRHDTAAYFACFSPDATFLFHTHDQPLRSRAAYEALWASWEQEEGFRVLGCDSSNQHVQLLGDVAVFTHHVRTVVHVAGAEETTEERETIVFRHGHTGGWTAVHEHLSPAPPPAG